MGLHFTSQDCSLCGNSRKKYNKLADGFICADCRKPLEKSQRFLSRAWSKQMTLQEVRTVRDLAARPVRLILPPVFGVDEEAI